VDHAAQQSFSQSSCCPPVFCRCGGMRRAMRFRGNNAICRELLGTRSEWWCVPSHLNTSRRLVKETRHERDPD